MLGHRVGAFTARTCRAIHLMRICRSVPLIILVIGGMLLHNGLIWVRKLAARKREARAIVRLSVVNEQEIQVASRGVGAGESDAALHTDSGRVEQSRA